jgi:hypothetical protein
MESRLAHQAEAALLEIMRRMTPEQRLDAFLEHCQLVMELYDAGLQQRAKAAQTAGEKQGGAGLAGRR